MIETRINYKLLEYFRAEFDNRKVSYLSIPQKFPRGAETQVYKFQLKNAPTELSRPLVLRVYQQHSQDTRAILEGTVQNYLVENDYPAPKVHYICTDDSKIGLPFIIMNYVPGELLGQYERNVPQTMAELSLNLHRIDSESLRKTLLSKGIEEKYFTGLGEREDYVQSKNIEWLMPGLDWIHENKPQTENVICPGDLHANNIKMENGEVSGVLDWAGLIDDPCRDIGSILILYTVMAPCNMPNRRSELKTRVMTYLDLYLAERWLDSWKLEYYQAVRCFCVMVDYEYGFQRVLSSRMHIACLERFKEITGIELKLEEPFK